MAAAAIDQPTSRNVNADPMDNARHVQTSHAGLRKSAVTAVARCKSVSRLKAKAKVVPERQGRALAAQPKTAACPRQVMARLTRGSGGDGSLMRGRILPSARAGLPE